MPVIKRLIAIQKNGPLLMVRHRADIGRFNVDIVQGYLSEVKSYITAILYLGMRCLFLLAVAVNGLKTNENFAVLGCNNEVTKKPELTISIKATYFNQNLSGLLNQACFEFI